MTTGVRLYWIILAALALGAAVPVAQAQPMPPEECEKARAEQGELTAAGTAGDLARGGEWGRTNLSEDRLKKVARWIELEEQIQFRCPRAKPVPQTAAAGAGPKKKPVAKATAEEGVLAGPGAEGPAAVEPAQIKTPAEAPAKKQKQRRKADDAYIPSTPYGGEEYHNTTPGTAVPADAGSALAP